ncbi:hypothetical protein [Streptomyces umbrinus]|uniref:hypothetical protein n=1 Tax=Streptomyces umbrinus TaxID=67370 RepID=UPI0034197539
MLCLSDGRIIYWHVYHAVADGAGLIEAAPKMRGLASFAYVNFGTVKTVRLQGWAAFCPWRARRATDSLLPGRKQAVEPALVPTQLVVSVSLLDPCWSVFRERRLSQVTHCWQYPAQRVAGEAPPRY